MDKSKSQNSKKLINPKLLYTLPLASVGLCFINQNVNAMFRNSLAFFKGLEQKSSTSQTLTPLTRPSTSSTPTNGRFFTNSSGIRVPIQTSSNLETRPKTTTSTPSTSTSSLGARPKTSSSISTQPTSSSSKKQEPIKSSSPYIENSPIDMVQRDLSTALLNRTNKQHIPPGEEPEDNIILNNLKIGIYDLSVDIFNDKMKSHLISQNIYLSPDIEKNINESSKNFGNHVADLAVNTVNSGIKYFNFITSPEHDTSLDYTSSIIMIKNMYGNDFKNSFDKMLKNSIDTFTSSLK